jgi:hypothetical protein
MELYDAKTMKTLHIFTLAFLMFLTLACPVARGQWDTPVPIRWVSVLPGTCDPTKRTNVLVYKYSAPVGFYYCSGTNTWTQVNAAFGTGITSLNTLNGSTQSFATGSTGVDFTIASSGSTHTFLLPSASAVNRGLLASADFTTFNNKLGTLNSLTGASQNFSAGTGGSDFNIISSGSTHTFNFPNASASNRGLLASADFTTFTNKLGTLNGLTGGTQTFAAPGAADTAAWSSSGTAHTLNLPIQAVSGTSRTNYFPYFNAANTLAKSPVSWSGTAYTFSNSGLDATFNFVLTPSSTNAGSFVLGKNTATLNYISIDQATGVGNFQTNGAMTVGSVNGALSLIGTTFNYGSNYLKANPSGGEYEFGGSSRAKIFADTGVGSMSFGDTDGVGNGAVLNIDDSADSIGITANTVSVTGSTFLFNTGKFHVTTSQTPASAGAACTAGQIVWDASYFYVCVATNTWRRAAHSTW